MVKVNTTSAIMCGENSVTTTPEGAVIANGIHVSDVTATSSDITVTSSDVTATVSATASNDSFFFCAICDYCECTQCHEKIGTHVRSLPHIFDSPLEVISEEKLQYLESLDSSGKWMLFTTKKTKDRVWATVCQALQDGLLGTTAKMSMNANPVICVYLDTSDVSELCRVALVLREKIGRASWNSIEGNSALRCIQYKPNVWTLQKVCFI